MSVNGIRRAVLGLATTALAGGIALTGAGAASASSGGGCGGPGWKQTCISAGGGQVSAQVTTNFASNNCTEQIIIWDYTTGGQALSTSFPCRSGQYSYTYTLNNPTPGHDYKAEARFYWQPGSGYDYQLSPDLWY
ncbi:hypothetical protein OG689_34395 [Kitasatospora sp. NBC_00240]|uniref:hypothetical protein n=1 Tax=Kitasatospora sp. NBC_00240 TaxID=2903567 RepID=UPI0022522D1B|nr:hypothetical protein [Kitasatospora sp. NBC_00240]MCX5214298.1 hypothetical protein [Kitasatospora sp. NBC_00240]